MTSHGLAAYSPAPKKSAPYASNFYLGRDDPFFDGMLKMEFGWSILNTMVPSKPAGK